LYALLLVSKIILEKLKELNPSLPPINKKERKLMKIEMKKLIKESKT
jgi:hypothetical protein